MITTTVTTTSVTTDDKGFTAYLCTFCADMVARIAGQGRPPILLGHMIDHANTSIPLITIAGDYAKHDTSCDGCTHYNMRKDMPVFWLAPHAVTTVTTITSAVTY